MGFKRCPGSSAFAQPRIEIVKCPSCGGDAEVWSDEPTGTCLGCGCSVTRTTTQSCLDWCKYSRECLGDEKYKQYQTLKASMRKQALVAAATDRFSWGKRQQNEAWEALERAEQLLQTQDDADPNVVLATVMIRLGCDGTPSGSSIKAVHAVARELLESLDYPSGFVEKVCKLVAPDSSDPDPDAATVQAAMLRPSENEGD
ncbi:MAG: hypothetical protein HN919_17310 [Verrucomicrobia bacterium]|mgnify:CR=1 FL=1|jgi:hypothetical protein|nr:hypothetical protein [Verrucomicrobiota bacterium]MBT7068060.1 hypothetical protein [Verrucomicrobiota bacterium]